MIGISNCLPFLIALLDGLITRLRTSLKSSSFNSMSFLARISPMLLSLSDGSSWYTISSGSSSSSPSPSTLATPTTPIVPGGLAVTKGATEAGSGNKLKTKGTNVSQGSGALSWGQMMMAKWHWGLLFAIAWAISSRLTGSS